MIVAFLFNSDDPKYGGYYGEPIRKLILSSNILQQSGRHLKISVGDVLILSHAKTTEEYLFLCEQTYFWHPWNYLFQDKIRATYLKATVFAWVIQNITEEITKSLHSNLKGDSAYLGMHALDYSYPIHLALYRNSMISQFRIKGKKCNLYYSSLDEEENKDYWEFETLEEFGFDVDWEDTGARQTIFNDYDTLEHFSQVKDFVDAIAPYLSGGTDEAEELAMLLEDLDPKLFDSLGAAVRAFKRAQNEEDLAHVGLSGRRFMEQLADVLFPATHEPYKGREVTRDKYKNRLWAFVDLALPASESERATKFTALGKEIDRLIKEFNAAIHGNPDNDRVGQAYGDLAKFTVKLLSISPDMVRKPYYAYQKSLNEFMKQVFELDKQDLDE